MADDLVEGSIYNQVKAMESWALNAYQESVKKSPNVDLILDNLRKINLQGRKLEWRGKGLESLPKGQVAEDLKKKVTQLRAAVVTLRDIKKDKELSNASKRTLRVLSAVATEARKLVEQFAKGLPDLRTMDTDQKEDFLRGEGEYASFALDVRRKLWNDYSKVMVRVSMKDYNLSGCDLHDFDFSLKLIEDCNFSQANLMGASFSLSALLRCKFVKSNLEGTNFSKANISTTVFFTDVEAIKANFKEAQITKEGIMLNLTFSGNFDGADFSDVTVDKDAFMGMKDISFNGVTFRRANMFWNLYSNRISLVGADLRRATIGVMPLSQVFFSEDTFRDANVDNSQWLINTSSQIFISYFEKAFRKAKNWKDAKVVFK